MLRPLARRPARPVGPGAPSTPGPERRPAPVYARRYAPIPPATVVAQHLLRYARTISGCDLPDMPDLRYRNKCSLTGARGRVGIPDGGGAGESLAVRFSSSGEFIRMRFRVAGREYLAGLARPAGERAAGGSAPRARRNERRICRYSGQPASRSLRITCGNIASCGPDPRKLGVNPRNRVFPHVVLARPGRDGALASLPAHASRQNQPARQGQSLPGRAWAVWRQSAQRRPRRRPPATTVGNDRRRTAPPRAVAPRAADRRVPGRT